MPGFPGRSRQALVVHSQLPALARVLVVIENLYHLCAFPLAPEPLVRMRAAPRSCRTILIVLFTDVRQSHLSRRRLGQVQPAAWTCVCAAGRCCAWRDAQHGTGRKLCHRERRHLCACKCFGCCVPDTVSLTADTQFNSPMYGH